MKVAGISIVLAVLAVVGGAQETSDLGALTGELIWKGARFSPREVVWPPEHRGSDAALEELIKRAHPLDERVVVAADNGGIRDCVVSLMGFPQKTATAPELEIEIRDLRFEPRVASLRPDARLRIRNSDPIAYELRIEVDGVANDGSHLIAAGGELLLELPEGSCLRLREQRFDFLQFAMVRTAARPTLVTGVNGGFAFNSVPVGKHQIEVWHESLGVVSKTVEVVAGETARLVVAHTEFMRDPPDPPAPFAGVGAPALRIEGVLVGRRDLDRLVTYYRKRHDDFVLPEELLTRYAVQRVLMPICAMHASHRRDAARLRIEARAIRKRLDEGRSFVDELAMPPEGADSSRAGLIESRSRRDLDPALGLEVFAAEKGAVVGPIHSARGLHFIQLVAVSEDSGEERRSFRHLFLKYRADWGLGRLDFEAREQARRARVEILDPALKSAVPVENRR